MLTPHLLFSWYPHHGVKNQSLKTKARLMFSVQAKGFMKKTNGLPKNVPGILEVVTKRERAGVVHVENEGLFQALFERSPDAVMLIDPYDPQGAWPIVDCNTQACQMNGYRRAELIGQSIDI